MDDFARRPAEERAEIFGEAARRKNTTFAVVEKDFWVCWTLRRLFALADAGESLLFKGGTSLSKVYGLIDRFSEDIDLSIARSRLGSVDDHDPANVSGTKARERSLDKLAEAARKFVREELRESLTAAIRVELGEGSEFRLDRDEIDKDGQTLLFEYPRAKGIDSQRGSDYLRPVVRLEFGARGDQWPDEQGEVRPYAAEEFPELFADPATSVRVLSPKRTFWEKATILHAWYHRPAEKSFLDRQSRHYFDLVRMWGHPVGQAAVRDTTLLEAVAQHKQVFFHEPKARYELAAPGTLRLVPPTARRDELERDYRKMREMIFGQPPTFAELLAGLAAIEEAVNGSAITDAAWDG